MKSTYKIGITVIVLALILISMTLMIDKPTLTDISSSLFFGGYLLSMIFAAIMSGILVAPNMNHKQKKHEYKAKSTELNKVEKQNKIDISFTSESKSLYADLLYIDEKIKSIKKEMNK